MKRILVPIDFSDVTPRVIGVAQQLATALDAEIHLIHVRELSAAAARRLQNLDLPARSR